MPPRTDHHSWRVFADSFLFVLLIGLFVATRLWRLTTYSLRADEIFSVKAARHDWSGLLSVSIADVVHPPLFYSLLKLWMILGGQSEGWLRLLPVLAAVASLIPFTLLSRELGFTPSERNVALFLISVNGFLIYYAQELRMYSLLMLVSLGSLWMFLRFLRAAPGSRRELVALLAINVILIYTQYYGWLVVFVELLIVFVARHRERKWFLLSIAALGLCFSPWAYLAGREAIRRGGLESNIGSFPRPHFVQDLLGFYAMLSGDFSSGWKGFLGLVFCLFPIALWVISARRTSSPDADSGSPSSLLAWLSSFAFLPVLLSFGFSQFLPQSVWGTRFLIITGVPYLLLVTAASFRVASLPLKLIAISLILIWAVLASVQDLENTGKDAWAPVVREMMRAEDASNGPVMVYTFDSSDETIQFYLDEAQDRRFRPVRIASLNDMHTKHFWVVLRSSPDTLVKAGFVVGPGFRDGFGAGLFPIWRQ